MAQVQLKGKLLIGAVLTVKTGLHIGDSSDFAPIGAVDSPFIRDPLTKAPIIPGSSLKGKMRTLLAKVLDEKVEEDGKISLPKPEKDETVVARLFGISSVILTYINFEVSRVINSDAGLSLTACTNRCFLRIQCDIARIRVSHFSGTVYNLSLIHI